MNSILDCRSASEFLGAEYSKRKTRNDAYSLRAFARDLGLSASRLSEVMKGQEGLSEKSADLIARKLKLKTVDRGVWMDLILTESSRHAKVRELAARRLEEARRADSFRNLREEQFRVIADWYHSAILELVHLKEFRSDIEWIADRIGVDPSVAADALGRLRQLGLLAQDESGRWTARPEAYTTFAEVPSSAIRRFHRQVLEMHLQSIQDDPMEDRETYSMILAIPRSALPEFAQDIKKFMTQFWQKIEDVPKDDLYSMSLQLCPVRDRKRRGKKP